MKEQTTPEKRATAAEENSVQLSEQETAERDGCALPVPAEEKTGREAPVLPARAKRKDAGQSSAAGQEDAQQAEAKKRRRKI